METQTMPAKVLSLPGFGTQQDQALCLAVRVELLLVPCCSRDTASSKRFTFSGNVRWHFSGRQRAVQNSVTEYREFLSTTSTQSDSWDSFNLAKVIIWLFPKYLTFTLKERHVLVIDNLCLINVFQKRQNIVNNHLKIEVMHICHPESWGKCPVKSVCLVRASHCHIPAASVIYWKPYPRSWVKQLALKAWYSVSLLLSTTNVFH